MNTKLLGVKVPHPVGDVDNNTVTEPRGRCESVRLTSSGVYELTYTVLVDSCTLTVLQQRVCTTTICSVRAFSDNSSPRSLSVKQYTRYEVCGVRPGIVTTAELSEETALNPGSTI